MAKILKEGFNPLKTVQILMVGLLFLFVISQIIDFSAISGEDKCLGQTPVGDDCLIQKTEGTCGTQTGCVWGSPAIFREDFKYDELATGFFKWLIISMAAYLAWVTVILRTGARFDKKSLVNLVIVAVILFVLYNKVLAPQLGFDAIEFSAYQLQALVSP